MTAAGPQLAAAQDAVPTDPVVRLAGFQRDHAEVTIIPPATPLGRWLAVFPPRDTGGHEYRTTARSWDLGGLMDQLDDVFASGSG